MNGVMGADDDTVCTLRVARVSLLLLKQLNMTDTL
jgi:hypothetical protein